MEEAGDAGVGVSNPQTEMMYTYVVVGGGIAGVTCAETLSPWCTGGERVLLLTASPLIKACTNFKQVTRRLEDFDVEERPMHHLEAECENVDVVQARLTGLDADNKVVSCANGKNYGYKRLCICTGGSPKLIAMDNPYVIGIRDTETVQVFQKKLADAKRIVVIGNGGIATEIVHEIEGSEVIWAIKDSSISSTFVDAGAAQFFLPQLTASKQPKEGPLKRHKYTTQVVNITGANKEGTLGSALGPDWSEGLQMRGKQDISHNIHVEYKVEISKLLTPDDIKANEIKVSCPESFKEEDTWPVYVEFNNGKIYGCDFVVSATGVIPNTGALVDSCKSAMEEDGGLEVNKHKFAVAEDGGLEVNQHMQTSVAGVYAAGDVCTTTWTPAEHWQQMRLWSQARQMGHYAAKCMEADIQGELDQLPMDFCFELFAHVTKFFNYKVVLLGKYNAQGLGKDEHDLLVRVTKGSEYVKTVMVDGRMMGAVLIGDTDLEETFENLILNGMDLSVYGEDLLDPNIDIEDYFD